MDKLEQPLAERADEMKPMGERILLAYYEGAYGPTIRIDVQTEDQLVAFMRLIKDLASARTPEVRLHEMRGFFELDGIAAITMRLASGKRPLKALKLLQENTDKREFAWLLDQDGWLRCAGLIEGLQEEHASGHQYLTREGVDDALVELCFKE